MNLVYDPSRDTFTTDVVAVADGYTACRQALYELLANYSRDDAIKALKKTLEDWESA